MTLRRGAWVRPVATITGLYVCPTILLATGIIPYRLRFHLLILATLVAVVTAIWRGDSIKRLGLALERSPLLLVSSVLLSALLVGAIAFSILPHPQFAQERLPFYLFFVLVSAPAQEFLYRSFLFVELEKLGIPWLANAMVSALLFSFMHIIYRDVVTVHAITTNPLYYDFVVLPFLNEHRCDPRSDGKARQRQRIFWQR